MHYGVLLKFMTFDQAKHKIIAEGMDGIAYSSRMGDYSTKSNFYSLIEAIEVVTENLRGEDRVDRELFSSLFTIGNQVEGNMHGALAKGLTVPDWLWDEGIVALNEALSCVFDDC